MMSVLLYPAGTGCRRPGAGARSWDCGSCFRQPGARLRQGAPFRQRQLCCRPACPLTCLPACRPACPWDGPLACSPCRPTRPPQAHHGVYAALSCRRAARRGRARHRQAGSAQFEGFRSSIESGWTRFKRKCRDRKGRDLLHRSSEESRRRSWPCSRARCAPEPTRIHC